MFTSKKILSLILLALASVTSHADDTSIITRSTLPPPPKILFLMDNSSSMSASTAGGSTRLQVLKDTFTSVIDTIDPTIEVGVTYYSGDAYKERGIAYPISNLGVNATTLLESNLLPSSLNTGLNYGMFDLSTDNLHDPASSADTSKIYIQQMVNSWSTGGYTPIPASLLETVRYFKGQRPIRVAANHARGAHPSSYTGQIYSTKDPLALDGRISYCATPESCPPHPDACELVDTSNFTHLPYVHGKSSCVANGTCTGRCSRGSDPTEEEIQAALDAYNAALDTYNNSTPSKECTVNDGSCGVQCVSDGTANEPHYLCKEDPPTYYPPQPVYSCGQFYKCTGPRRDDWHLTSNANYISPITNACDNTILALLSDGAPQYKTSNRAQRKKSNIENYLNHTCAAVSGATPANKLAHGECGSDLVYHLANTDLRPDLDGDQHVTTYTIGFGVGTNTPAESYLSSLASSGGGSYFSAGTNAGDLSQAFNDLIDTATQEGTLTLAGSAISVNADTQISHNNDVFVPVIKKVEGKTVWEGNLKKFRISNGIVVDQNNAPAINNNGSIKPAAKDLWSTAATENVDPVLSGGAVGLLSPVRRKLYTDISTTAAANSGNKGRRGTSLDELKTSNTAITLAHLAAPTTAYKNELLDYIRGYDIPTTGNSACTHPGTAVVTDTGNCATRQHMGDILHSKPVVISYDDADPAKRYVFFGTNEGFLHAISADHRTSNLESGREKFAFMPQPLLQNIDTLYRNDANDSHPFGVDGSIKVWRHDENNDGAINASDNDFVYIYFGLRRGGNTYYALNVTDISHPKILWKKDASSTGFSELGQTWSKPLLAKIKYKQSGTMVEKMAMVVGAGYNANEDEESPVLRTVDTSGRGIFILDAETGSIIQSISNITDMNYSIPGDIRVLDMNQDGSMDRLYYADVGGNIWRTDLFTSTTDAHILHPTTRKFASLGEDVANSALDTRKFFHEPEVSLFNRMGTPTLVVTIGSGYHSQPLNTDISDRFYVLLDRNIYATPTRAPATITQSNLVAQSSLSGASITSNTNGKLGWYYDFPSSGEKALSSPVVILNKVLFTTFKPGADGLSGNLSCSATNTHESKFYAFNLLTGGGVLDFDGDNSNDISKELPEGHILATPELFFRDPNCVDTAHCSQVVDIKTSLAAPVVNIESHPGKATSQTATTSVDIGSFTPKIFWLDPQK